MSEDSSGIGTMTKEDRIWGEMSESMEHREDRGMLAKWERLEKIFMGDYAQLGMDDEFYSYAYGTLAAGHVKSNLMHQVITQKAAMLMPPANFSYVVQPVDSENELDIAGSVTGGCLLNYGHRVQGGMTKMRQRIIDALLLNNTYLWVGFRADVRDETKEEQANNETTESPIDDSVADIDKGGDNRKPGLAFDERIENKNFLLSRGFASVKEAWAPGGWVAHRFWTHEEDFRANKAFKFRHGPNKLMPDVEYRGILSDNKGSASIPAKSQLKYMELWRRFVAPTEGSPKGRTQVWSQTRKKLIYDEEGMPYAGINFPIFEFRVDTPREGYHVTPTAYRAINALLEHEWFETTTMQQIAASKQIIITNNSGADEVKEEIQSVGHVKIVNSGNLKPSDVQHIDIDINTTPAEQGSFRAKARFEEILGLSLSQPRLKDKKIATEMVLKNKTFMSELNDLLMRINMFEEEIATAKLIIEKQKMSPEEQVRICRSVKAVWKDTNKVTLEGNYAVKVKASPLLNMTQGEQANVTQAYLSLLSQIQQMPQYASSINILPMLKQFGQNLGMPTAGVIIEQQDIDQFFEIAMMLSGVPVDAEPSDPHVKHLNDINTYLTILEESKKELEDTEQEAILAHAEQHQKMAEEQSQGAPGLNVVANLTNIERQASGAAQSPAGGAGLPASVQSSNQLGGGA